MDRKEEKKRFRLKVIELENLPGAIPDSHSAVYTDALRECRYIYWLAPNDPMKIQLLNFPRPRH